ncbi:Tetratricopeptide repeat-like superfamily protein, putative isoform 2 [Hibiscus syriacus]|uniref:Tetratricopeptide repeat-like superfamily protein, putative isoform 2 n=1 Tax=Hibiscus syriacus TaxID=106335 RepID=A0A6A3CME4_HIBSY|nr:uncharacterized protein LOC120165402 [Hibiscus syriacus]KAE8730615.1 Tetratricopeptide repeat-like superfamily protein, putative isoform 2 [Hibiscus syriacus]
MMLRSSSTPLLGSLISSIAADSPNSNSHYYETGSPFRHHPSSSFHGRTHHNRLSFHPSPGSLHLSTAVYCGSSPISPSVVDQFSDFELKGFRRAQSEGNLEGLVHSAYDGSGEFYHRNQPKKLSARNNCFMLETIPSFSIYNSGARCEEEDESDFEEEEEKEKEEFQLKENEEMVIAAVKGSSHGFNSISLDNLLLNEQVKVIDEKGLVGQEMFLPTGIQTATDGGNRSGISGGYGNRSGGFNSAGSNGDGEVEEYYKRMVEENPGNPLFLENYAQFLYQSKRDLEGAEEYYGRAILADPKDGGTLSQYAKLVWELHGDEERASSYFERAVQASPQDSHVHAAYATFLWETEEGGNECAAPGDLDAIPSRIHQGTLARA